MALLHSIISGNGTPVVILHGFLGMADNWKTLGKKWSEHGYEVHLLDQRNHGRSFHDPVFNYQVMATDLYEYCLHHQLEEIYLLGHSMGGKVAMEFVQQHGLLVKKLIVADIAPKPYPAHHGDIFKALRAVDFASITRRNEANDAMKPLIPDMGTRQFLLKSLYRTDQKKFGWRFNIDVLGAGQHVVGAHTEQEFNISTPTLFVRGGDSGYILDEDLPQIERLFSNVQLATIPNAGHWLHAQEPDSFYEIVSNFMNSEGN
ncbi:MAG: alpha/beta fold hydrolase [Nonlabens sp.]